jgi:hypothetical protein
VEEAVAALAAMVEKFNSQGYRVDEQHLADDEYPQYAVYDRSDTWIGTYTISLQ